MPEQPGLCNPCPSFSHVLALCFYPAKTSALSWECLKGLHGKSMWNYLSRKVAFQLSKWFKAAIFTLSNSDNAQIASLSDFKIFKEKSYFVKHSRERVLSHLFSDITSFLLTVTIFTSVQFLYFSRAKFCLILLLTNSYQLVSVKYSRGVR